MEKKGRNRGVGEKRMVTRRSFLKGVVAAGAGLAASSVGGFAPPVRAQRGPLKIAIWSLTNPQQFPFLKKRVDMFMEKNKNVQVDMQMLVFADLGKKVNLGYATGTAPDGFQTGSWLMPTWLDRGLIAPMDVQRLGYSSLQDFINDQPKGYIEGALKDGKVYGYPVWFYGYLNYINTKHFKEAGLNLERDEPQTWAQLGEVAKKLTVKKGGKFVRQGFKFAIHSAMWTMIQFNPIFMQCGGSWFDKNGKCAVNSEAGVKAVAIRRSIVKDYGAEDPADTLAINPVPMMDFARERCSMFSSHPIPPGIFQENNPTMDKERYYRPVQMPGVSASQRYSTCYGFNMLINAQTSKEKQDVLHDIYKFMMADLIDCWEATKPFPPARKSGWRNHASVQNFPYVNEIIKAQENGVFLPNTVVFNELMDSMHRAVQRIMLNNADIKQTLEEAAREVDRASEEYRQKKS